ncbi:MAG: ATP-binding protein [Synechococcales bacterium]|nr:ATP-binding protein [Synechococcales bacterium]
MSGPVFPTPNGTKDDSQEVALLQGYDTQCLYQTDLIQCHGCLLALQPQTGRILQISENCTDFFGETAESLLDQPLQNYLPSKAWKLLQPLITQQVIHLSPFRFTLAGSTGKRLMQAIAHRVEMPEIYSDAAHPAAGATEPGETHPIALELITSEPIVILELEPIAPGASLDWMSLLHRFMAKSPYAEDLVSFLQQVAEEIHHITGFDRILVYQFDQNQAGCVIAEVKPPDQPPYLHHWYPAEDIPDAVRDFYCQGKVRYVPDLITDSVCLVPSINPITHNLLDLTRSHLRGVDPCCVEFHRTMQVQALMVIALLKEEKLWGLITCHHPHPKFLPYEARFACEVIGQLTSTELARRVNQQALDTVVAARQLQVNFINAIAQVQDLKSALTHPDSHLLHLVQAQGVAICLGDDITLLGQTPNPDQVTALLTWMGDQFQSSIFQTNALPDLYPPAEEFVTQASGLLALCISQAQRYYILWFRAEILQTIAWAGNPEPTYQTLIDGTRQRSPRQSFAQWKQTVRGTAVPWQATDVENVLALRNAIVGMILKTTDDLTKLNLELQRSNQELESFAYIASHDLKEPLRGIYNSITFLLEDYGNLLDPPGIDRLNNMMRLTHRLENLIDALLHFSRLGQMELILQPTDLQTLFLQELQVVQESHPGRCPELLIPRSLPTVTCGALQVSQIYRNLLSNAFKYQQETTPWVEVGYWTGVEVQADPTLLADCPQARSHLEALVFDKPEDQLYVFYVKDNGIGIRDRHLDTIFRLFKRLHPPTLYQGGTGTGLTIVKKMIERHHGKVWVESTLGVGTTFYFTLSS